MSMRFDDIFGVVWFIIYVGGISACGAYLILYKLLVWLTGWEYDFEQPWWFEPSIIVISIAIAIVGWYLIIEHDRKKHPRQLNEAKSQSRQNNK